MLIFALNIDYGYSDIHKITIKNAKTPQKNKHCDILMY